MNITKVINNNIVCSVNEQGQELVMMGCGIGFGKKAGDGIDQKKIEKTYQLQDQSASHKLIQLLQDVPPEHVNTCNRIIEYTQKTLDKKLSDNIYITLTDHISFAIQRLQNGLEYKNELLWEIRRFYPKEYRIGLDALRMIEADLSVQLSEDEAGFIALHIVTAQVDSSMEHTVNTTTLIHQILDIVTDYYNMDLDEESLDYERFITHLKFFGQRIFKKRKSNAEDTQFQSMVRDRYRTDYDCAVRIREMVEAQYSYHISEDEMIFLTVHLRRISMAAE